MSRIGKNPVAIPDKVDVQLQGATVKVKGPGGNLEYSFTDKVKIKKVDKTVEVAPVNNSQECRSLWGTTRTLINNMVLGVTQGFSKGLEFNGVGYRAAVKGNVMVLNLGYSHAIEYPLPAGIKAKVVKNIITVSGCDKELVGFAAAKIRSYRPVEPYKGKGIKYVGERVIKKAGKGAGKK